MGRVVQVIESHEAKTYLLETYVADYLRSHPTCRLVVLEDVLHPQNPIMRLFYWLADGCKCTYQKRIITDRIVKLGEIAELTAIQLKVPTNYYVTFEDRF